MVDLLLTVLSGSSVLYSVQYLLVAAVPSTVKCQPAEGGGVRRREYRPWSVGYQVLYGVYCSL